MKKFYLLILTFILGIAVTHAAITWRISGNLRDLQKNYWMDYKLVKDSDTDYHMSVQIKEAGNYEYLVYNGDTAYGPTDNYRNGNGEGDITNGGRSQQMQKGSSMGVNFRFYAPTPGVYKIYVYTNSMWTKVERTSDSYPTGDYYLYADINRWSSLKNAGQSITIHNSSKKDVTTTVFPDGAPSYYSTTTLNNNWKFKPVDGTHNKKGEGWYYLDMKNLRDAAGYTGRICGQFKITMGDHTNDANWGLSIPGGDNKSDEDIKDYLYDGVKVNTDYSILRESGLQNIILNDNFVENAVIYFNPETNQIYIDGNSRSAYVYYGAVRTGNTNDFGQPSGQEMLDLSQENYYANVKGFNGDSFFNEGRYTWEKILAAEAPDYGLTVNADGSKIVYNGTEFPYVYRRLIPPSAMHRYPIEMNIKITNDKGTLTFPQATVGCQDIWFIEADVNLYYRYETDEDTQSLSWVVYNGFNKSYDKIGVIEGYNYIFGGYRTTDDDKGQPLIVNGEWGVATLVNLNDGNHADLLAKLPAKYKEARYYHWWKSPLSIPYSFTSNAWAMFGDSRGAVFPADRVKAIDEDLNSVEIAGNDVYYVVPTTNQNPEILYSHLKGTATKNSGTVQINAEFFNEDGELVTDVNAVTYNFDIYYDGIWVAGTSSEKGNTVHFTKLPFFNWNVSDCESGFYFIVVKVKDANDEIYTATDVYPLFTK